MSVKLIAMDLDGTLMAPDHITVTEKTKSALIKANEIGIKTVIATGRTLSVINNVLKQLPFIDYVIYSNGAAVLDRCKDENIYTKPIPADIVSKIVDILERYPVYYEVYSSGSSHAQESKSGFFKNKDLPQEFLEFYMQSIQNHNSISDFAKNSEIEKINLFYFDGEYYDEIKEQLYALGGLDLTSPVSGDIEMTSAGVNKGEALNGMCKELGFTQEEVMAFGDADNDIEMLQFAGLGIAMANASAECKEAAKYETLSNGEDGIAHAIDKYIFNTAKPKIIVSACLLGENCKYNGGNNFCEAVDNLKEKFELVPICPECFGGLPIPRVPNEIINGRAVSKEGKDYTKEYEDGAEKSLYVANECNCSYAVLKERSPSCGFGMVYDGTFTGKLVKGNGFTADLLYNNGIRVFGESQIDKLLNEFGF